MIVTIKGKMPAYKDGEDVSYDETHRYEVDSAELHDAGVIKKAIDMYCNEGNAGHIITSIELSKGLTTKDLDEMEPGIFAQGTVTDNPQGINMTNSGKLLKWVAVRGQAPDWAIYTHWDEHSYEYVRRSGDKMYSENNIKKLVNADEEAMNRYRF